MKASERGRFIAHDSSDFASRSDLKVGRYSKRQRKRLQHHSSDFASQSDLRSVDTAPARVGAFCERSPRIRPNSVVAPPLVCPSGRLRRGDIPRGRARRFGLAFAFQNASPIPLGLLRPLRGSGFALGQPDAFGAGESRSGYSRLTARIVPRVRGTFRDTTSDDDRTRGGAWRFSSAAFSA